MDHPNSDGDRRSIDLAEALGEEAADQLETAAAKLNLACDLFAQALLGADGWARSDEGRWAFATLLERILGHLERAGVPVH